MRWEVFVGGSAETTVTVSLKVLALDLEPEEHEEYTAELGRALRELDGVRLSTPVAGQSPAGSKGVGEDIVGALTVTVAASRKALSVVLGAVRLWAQAVASRTVEVQVGEKRIAVKGASPENIDRLVEAFAEELTRGDR